VTRPTLRLPRPEAAEYEAMIDRAWALGVVEARRDEWVALDLGAAGDEAIGRLAAWVRERGLR